MAFVKGIHRWPVTRKMFYFMKPSSWSLYISFIFGHVSHLETYGKFKIHLFYVERLFGRP